MFVGVVGFGFLVTVPAHLLADAVVFQVVVDQFPEAGKVVELIKSQVDTIVKLAL